MSSTKPTLVIYACNPTTWKAEARILSKGQKFKGSQNYSSKTLCKKVYKCIKLYIVILQHQIKRNYKQINV